MRVLNTSLALTNVRKGKQMAGNANSMIAQALEHAYDGENVVFVVRDHSRAVYVLQQLAERGMRAYLSEMTARIDDRGSIKVIALQAGQDARMSPRLKGLDPDRLIDERINYAYTRQMLA